MRDLEHILYLKSSFGPCHFFIHTRPSYFLLIYCRSTEYNFISFTFTFAAPRRKDTFNLCIVRTRSSQGFAVATQIASFFPTTLFLTSFLSQDPYFCTNVFLSEHHSQVNSLLLPVSPSDYCSNTGFPKPIQVILSMVSPHPLFSSTISFTFVYCPNLFYLIFLFLCIKTRFKAYMSNPEALLC